MKYCLSSETFPQQRVGILWGAPVAVALLLTLGCNNSPKVNASQGGSSGGSGTGGSVGGGSDASTGVVLPEVGGGGLGGSSGGDNDGGGGVDERQCGAEMFMLERLPPDLMLVLDRSSSMRESAMIPADPMATLWTETVGALDQVVMATHANVNWGLQLFPQPSGCQVAAVPEVGVAVNNYNMVLNTSKMAGPALASLTGGGTPTSAAMERAVAYLRGLTTKNPKYVVLATDGRPTCPPGDSDNAAIAAVTNAAAAGFKTYVIGIAINVNAQGILNSLATAGGVPRNDPAIKFYPVSSKADLVTALTAITGQVTNCVFPLSKPPPVPTNVKVTVSGAKVESDATNGWSYTAGNMAIQFNGAACEQVKTMPGNVQIIFGCPNEIIQ